MLSYADESAVNPAAAAAPPVNDMADEGNAFVRADFEAPSFRNAFKIYLSFNQINRSANALQNQSMNP